LLQLVAVFTLLRGNHRGERLARDRRVLVCRILVVRQAEAFEIVARMCPDRLDFEFRLAMQRARLHPHTRRLLHATGNIEAVVTIELVEARMCRTLPFEHLQPELELLALASDDDFFRLLGAGYCRRLGRRYGG